MNFLRLASAPHLLRERLAECKPHEIVIIDEIQKIPLLLDEVHHLVVCDLHYAALAHAN
jgi:hypothetical protein